MLLSFPSLLFAYALAIPFGIYSAVRKYSPADCALTFMGFIGRATPNFLLALILMYSGIKYFDAGAGGLFSPTRSWCYFHPRCRYAVERCAQEEPDLVDTGDGHLVRCLRTAELDLAGALN